MKKLSALLLSVWIVLCMVLILSAGALAAPGEEGSFDVSLELSHTVAAPAAGDGAKAFLGVDYTTTLSPESGYTLPRTVNVSIGGQTAPASAYCYDPDSGVLTIYGQKIVANITVTVKSCVGYFEFLGSPIGLPDQGKVRYGSAGDLVGTETSLSDSAFTALTPGRDYTWWVRYDEAKACYSLLLKGFVMTKSYDTGSVLVFSDTRPMALTLTDSSLAGSCAGKPVVDSAGPLSFNADNAALTQNNGGDLVDSAVSISAAVKNSALLAVNDDRKGGGAVFAIDNNQSDASLTASFSGQNQVSAYEFLLGNRDLTKATAVSLSIKDDLSFTSLKNAAITANGKIEITVADSAVLTLESASSRCTPAIAGGGGNVTIRGGCVSLSSQGFAVATKGSVTAEDTTLTATGGKAYGAFWAMGGISLGEGVAVTLPKSGAVKKITWTGYYDSGQALAYVKAEGGTTVYYDVLHDTAITKADFEAASVNCTPDGPHDVYTVSNAVLGAPTAQLSLTYTQENYYTKTDLGYEALDADVDAAYNAKEAVALTALPGQAYVKMEAGNNKISYVPVTLSWSLQNYNGNRGGVYTAAATVSFSAKNAAYPGITTLNGVAGTVKITPPPHQCIHYSDAAAWVGWAEPYICFVIENTLMSGGSATKLYFDANGTVTRAMVVQMLYNVSGRPVQGEANFYEYGARFSDVGADQWYYDAVVWATNNAIATGVGNGCFDPNTAVSREQVVTFFWRFAGCPAAGDSLGTFYDSAKVSPYAELAFSWAAEKTIINGSGDSKGVALSPDTNCTRAQMAVIMTKYARTLMTDNLWINISDGI